MSLKSDAKVIKDETVIGANTALRVGQLFEDFADAVDLNTAKVGITTQQASDITANNAKVGVTNEEQNAPNTTLQGNTFNGANQLVKTDENGKIQAIEDLNLGAYKSRGYWKGTQAEYDLLTIDSNTDYDIIEL